jgi:hypothetical protein
MYPTASPSPAEIALEHGDETGPDHCAHAGPAGVI